MYEGPSVDAAVAAVIAAETSLSVTGLFGEAHSGLAEGRRGGEAGIIKIPALAVCPELVLAPVEDRVQRGRVGRSSARCGGEEVRQFLGLGELARGIPRCSVQDR
jgi:hypothetical protein